MCVCLTKICIETNNTFSVNIISTYTPYPLAIFIGGGGGGVGDGEHQKERWGRTCVVCC
jgi:hypothetical protein